MILNDAVQSDGSASGAAVGRKRTMPLHHFCADEEDSETSRRGDCNPHPHAPSPTIAPKSIRVSRIAMLGATMLSPLCVAAFGPSHSSQTHTLHTHINQVLIAPQNRPRKHDANGHLTSTSLPAAAAAATAWLFTPDRTASILASTAEKSIVSTANAATDAALEVATHAAEVAAAVTTETVVQTIYKAPFISLLVSFVMGGLFFSTIAATVAAAMAFGKENTRRIRNALGIVYRRNMSVMKISMQLTMDVLRGKEKLSGFKNRFWAALQTFKDGIAEVRRVFTESVDAIKKETQMYSAAVGIPGLIPIQYIFDRIFPTMLTAPFQDALEDALLQIARDNPQIRKLLLKKFTMGEIAPKVLEARLFDLGKHDMAFDLEMDWKSNARADLDLSVSSFRAKIPVTIENLRFEGPVRLILVGLRRDDPGWEALLISLPRPPKIGFDIKVAGGLITQIPWLRNEFAKSLDDAVAEEVLWPRRAVVSAPTPFRAKPLLNPMQILSLMRDDPLLKMERDLMAAIPDDFLSTYQTQSQDDIPDFDIQVNGKTNGDAGDDDEGDSGANASQSAPEWLRFWQRKKQPATTESSVTDTLQLMAQSLQQESSHIGEQVRMPVMVLEGAEEKRSIGRRLLNNVLLPKSLLSYAAKEF